MRVCVIGTGYVGLVTGACLAEIGHHVVGVDKDAEKIALLSRGGVPIFEAGLEDLIERHGRTGQIRFTTDLYQAIQDSEILFITVGTPPTATGEPDLSAVEEVARTIGESLNGYKIIVNKSTVPIGSGDWVAMLVCDGINSKQLVGSGPSAVPPSFDVVSNPEFLREGSAIRDTFFPDRILLGAQSERAILRMRELYDPIIRRSPPGSAIPLGSEVPFIVTDLTSAEMIKYAANAFLACKISFANEIANLCERLGADYTQVSLGMGLDPRIGPLFLDAGIGWGGSCFPKDVAALIHMASAYGYDSSLLKAIQNVNRLQLSLVLSKLQRTLKILKGKVIGLLGLAFKPGTDDLREAPAMHLAQQLLKLGAKVQAYDPVAGPLAQARQPTLITCASPYEAAQGADAIVIATEWPEFAQLDLQRLRSHARGSLLLDGRNAIFPEVAEAAGFAYVGIGR